MFPVVIGPDCKYPFEAKSIFNISGMSYGAISAAAVRALSKGAGAAGIWMNTGEGGISPYHIEGQCDVIYQIGTAKYGVRDEAGNLSDEMASLARLLATSGISAQRTMQLHVQVLEELVRGLGNRSARHVMSRADLLVLEVMGHLADSYRQRYHERRWPPRQLRLPGFEDSHEDGELSNRMAA